MNKPKGKAKCKTRGCGNDAAKGRLVCHKCFMRKWRANNPLRSSYSTIRDHAGPRGIKFTLTFKHFEQIAKAQGLLDPKGKRNPNLDVDRIDATKGYEDGNIQILPHAENVSKGNYERQTNEYKREFSKRYERIRNPHKGLETTEAAEEPEPEYKGPLREGDPF